MKIKKLICSIFLVAVSISSIYAQSPLDNKSATDIAALNTASMASLLSDLVDGSLQLASNESIQVAINEIMAVVIPTEDESMIDSVARTIAEALFLRNKSANDILNMIAASLFGSGLPINQALADATSSGALAGIEQAASSMGMTQEEIDALLNEASASTAGQFIPGVTTVPNDISYDG